MVAFTSEVDTLVELVNKDIDNERQGVTGRPGLMRNFPEVTIDFLHYFLDGVLAGVEKEQGGGALPASGRASRNSRERFSTARSSART